MTFAKLTLFVCLLSFTSFASGASIAFGATGDPDPTFGGGDGIVQETFAGFSAAYNVTILSDGKILVVGTADDGTDLDFVVIRYNEDGSLDENFGDGGIVLTPVVVGESDGARFVAVREDGSLIVAGVSAFNDFVVVHYSAEGDFDPDFGVDGVFRLPGVQPSDSLGGMAVQPDGKIVLGGTKNMAMTVLRLLSDGSALDPDFGASGIATATLGGDQGEGRAMALESGGGILVGGRNATDGDFAVVRFDADGNQDMTFGDAGFAQQSLVAGIDYALAVGVQADGAIVAAGLTSSGVNDMGIARFDAEGLIDTAFNGTGFRVESVASGQDIANGLALPKDGRIVVVGSAYEGTEGAFGVLKLNDDGSLDDGFSGDGKARIVAGVNAEASAVAVDGQGRLVIVGQADDQFTVVRLEGDSIDLGVSLTADSASAPVGEVIELTASVSNGSTRSVGGVTMTVQIPSGLSLESAAGCSGTSALACPMGALAAGASAEVTVRVHGSTVGTFTTEASVTAQAVDPVASNDTASVSISVTEATPEPEPGESSGGCSLWPQ